MRPLRADTAATPEPAASSAGARSAEYRHFGDDSALLTVAVQAHAGELPGEARLITSDGREIPASAVTFQPQAGLARIVFAVDRGVASSALGASLHVAIGDQQVAVPEPVKRTAIGVPDPELDHAVAAGVAGDELAGLIRVLERRATIAERVASDVRERRSDHTKVAQAYREIWEVRELLESREEAYAASAERVDEALAAQRAAESDAAAARAELEDVRGESQAATMRLQEQLAELEADAAAARAEAEAADAAREEAVAERDDAIAERDAAIAVAEAERDVAVAEREKAVAAANAERDEAHAARDTAVAERHEAIAAAAAERDAAVASAQAARDDARAERDEAAAQRDEALAAADHAQAARDEAIAQSDAAAAARDDALDKLRAVRSDLAEATANVATWAAELEEARARAADAEALLVAERTLHEARLASRAGGERQVADLLAEAQRERLRQTPEDDQRAQVEALERQLARMKSARPSGG